MPKLILDGREVEVAAGQSVLAAARKLGLDIPTLCYLECCGPLNACLVCVVKVQFNGATRVVPACGTRALDGMVVESESHEVHALRRTALELLLSDHVGDCLSPCHRICPLDLNVPRMIRQIQAGQPDQAIQTVRQALALPAVLGRLCHAPCENGCRRSSCDGSAAIRELERFVADEDRRSGRRYLPPQKPPTGKRVAIVGAGPAGLAAAYDLLRQGHACTLFDRHDHPGGSLRAQVDAGALPAEVLHAELEQLARLGAEYRCRTAVGPGPTLTALQETFDAVLLTPGELAPADLAAFGLDAPTLKVDPTTYQAGRPRLFAAGSVVKPIPQLVRAMGEGQAAAACIQQHLAGHLIRPRVKTFSSVMGRLDEAELALFLHGASALPRATPASGFVAGFNPQEARREASRCLHCDCRAAGSCSLQHYATVYGANPNRFARQRRRFTQHTHPGRVIFEPGKCILCGICIELASQAAEPLGLTFVGRGFDVQVAAPLHHPFAEGLQKVARQCVEACPTGAIVLDEEAAPGSSPAATEGQVLR